MNWIFGVFLTAVAVSITAQWVSYYGGPRTRLRKVALAVGIVAVLLMVAANQLTLQDLRAKVVWRNLNDDQLLTIAKAVAGFPGTPYDREVAQDAESLNLLSQIGRALDGAHWAVKPWHDARTVIFDENHVSIGIIVATNVQVRFEVQSRIRFRTTREGTRFSSHCRGHSSHRQSFPVGSHES